MAILVGTPAPEEQEHGWRKVSHWANKQVKSSCTPAAFKRRIPIIGWLREYSLSALQSDLIAGITVGLTVIPQGIAYAAVAGLPVQYGLYTAFMGCFVYSVLGSTRQVNIGPTAIIALLTAQVGGADFAVLLGFLSGVVELLFVILNLGFLIDFISVPVISGFSSAAALIISATQLKGLFGLKFEAENFVMVIYYVCKNITKTKIPDLIMGLTSLVVLLSLRRIGAIKWGQNDDPEHPPSFFVRAARKTLWLVCTGRNALVVVIASIIAYMMSAEDPDIFSLTGDIKPGLPDFKPPPFSTVVGNSTIAFPEMVKNLGASIVLIPLVSILEHMAIAKVFAQGKSVDAKQELLALGVANVLGSFVSAFPCTGSFSRTALNGSCGIKTPLGGLYTGALVLLALGYLATSFKFIPKASLSAVIISAVVFMIEYEMVVHLWRTKKLELFVMMVTFFSCLGLGAEYGILVGIILSLIMLLYKAARPRIRIERSTAHQVEFIRIQPDQNLFFPAIEYLRFRMNKASNFGNTMPIVFDGSHISATDYTIAQGIKQILDDFKSRNQKIIFTNFKQEVIDLLHRMEAKDFSHMSNMEELEAICQDPVTKLQISSMNNSSWAPDMDLEFINPSATVIDVKITDQDLDDVKVWSSLSNGGNSISEADKDLKELLKSTEKDGEARTGLLASETLDEPNPAVLPNKDIAAVNKRTSDDDGNESTKV